MKNKEIITALGLAVSLSVGGCGTEAPQQEPVEDVAENTTLEQATEEAAPVVEDKEIDSPIVEEDNLEKEDSVPEDNSTDAEVSKQVEEDAETVEEVSDIESASGTYYATQNCNTRKGPSTDYEKISGLTYKQSVEVTGRSKTTGWYEIEINGEKQYVSDKFLSTTMPQDTTTSQSSTSTDNNNSQSGSTSQPSGGNINSGYPTGDLSREEAESLGLGDSYVDLDSVQWDTFDW